MLVAIPTIVNSHPKSDNPQIYTAPRLKWSDGPPSLPKGARITVLEGDPSKPGPFVFRVKVPDKYMVPWHVHPHVERVTVVSGTFNLKMDDGSMEVMPAGTFGYWPAGMKHTVWATGETVIQFHGTGPWAIQYVNPSDDPRAGK